MADFVGALDQGTTSTRFMIFDHAGREVGKHQLEHEQILPRAGWVEHNPLEIWERTQAVIGSALTTAGLHASDLAAMGVTNQRETTIVWDRHTGRPWHHAIVWQDTRTDAIAAALDADERGEVIRDGGKPLPNVGGRTAGDGDDAAVAVQADDRAAGKSGRGHGGGRHRQAGVLQRRGGLRLQMQAADAEARDEARDLLGRRVAADEERAERAQRADVIE